jgi:hypothetical protein
VELFGVFEAAVTGAMVVDDLFPAPAGGALAGIGFGVGVGVVPGAGVVVDGLAAAAFVPGVGVWASSKEAARDREGSSIWFSWGLPQPRYRLGTALPAESDPLQELHAKAQGLYGPTDHLGKPHR